MPRLHTATGPTRPREARVAHGAHHRAPGPLVQREDVVHVLEDGGKVSPTNVGKEEIGILVGKEVGKLVGLLEVGRFVGCPVGEVVG